MLDATTAGSSSDDQMGTGQGSGQDRGRRPPVGGSAAWGERGQQRVDLRGGETDGGAAAAAGDDERAGQRQPPSAEAGDEQAGDPVVAPSPGPAGPVAPSRP